jgi:hypothetical protein
MAEDRIEEIEFKEEELPPVDFKNFILGLSQSVYIYLGLVPDPITQKERKNLLLAKHTIDTLDMLKEKTKGNLTPEEESTFNYILSELKLKYVEVATSEENPKKE